MLAKMVVADEAKRATLPAALPLLPSLDALRSPITLLSTPIDGGPLSASPAIQPR
jgi:hypothetical protein